MDRVQSKFSEKIGNLKEIGFKYPTVQCSRHLCSSTYNTLANFCLDPPSPSRSEYKRNNQNHLFCLSASSPQKIYVSAVGTDCYQMDCKCFVCKQQRAYLCNCFTKEILTGKIIFFTMEFDIIFIVIVQILYLIRSVFSKRGSAKSNTAWCIANSICIVARKLESHCTLQILNQ